MAGLRLLADDLTGALDSAAAFASVKAPVTVLWNVLPGLPLPAGPALAFDAGTREWPAARAAARMGALAPLLTEPGDAIAFFKLDSLLRGHAGQELLAIHAAAPFDHIIIAPAIPFQGRITRGGRQMIAERGVWVATGESIAATLVAAGHDVTLSRPGDDLRPGISLWDAETDADLDAIVAGAAGRSVLWVGAAGLAGALARLHGVSTPAPVLPPPTQLPVPLLGLIGTHHPVMAAQLEHIPAQHLAIGAEPAAAAEAVANRLARRGAAFVTCALPEGLDRAAIETEIASRFAGLAAHLARPGALFVSGGETLRHLCDRLGARAIDCIGQFEPGVPISRLAGGIWDGMLLVSKSGAFGSPDFLLRLAAALPPCQEAAS